MKRSECLPYTLHGPLFQQIYISYPGPKKTVVVLTSPKMMYLLTFGLALVELSGEYCSPLSLTVIIFLPVMHVASMTCEGSEISQTYTQRERTANTYLAL